MRTLSGVLATGLALIATTFAQQDSFSGTWKLNVAKSKMQPATASKSEILLLTVTGEEETVSTDAVTADGSREVMKYTARYDGKVYPGATTITGKTVRTQKMNVVLRKIDARTRERLGMEGGKVTMRARRTLSEDGKTLTSTILGVGSDGKEIVREIRVFERQ
jgi:hypothetical protein